MRRVREGKGICTAVVGGDGSSEEDPRSPPTHGQ